MKVVVGSIAHCKIEGARAAFKQLFPNCQDQLTVEGVRVPSGVPATPVTNEQLRQGAINRATAAKDILPGADYYVGIEGGFATEFEQLFCAGWYAVLSQDTLSVGRSMSFLVPNEVAQLVQSGLELGEVVERVSKGNAVREKEGLIGLLTNGLYTRVDYDTHGVIAALSPMLWS